MGAFTYPRSEPGSAGHQDLVERLNTVVPALRREVTGLSDSTLSHRPADGEWSLKEIYGHLCDHARFLHDRLYRMIKLEQPLLEAWDEQQQMEERNPQAADIDGLLSEFSAQRTETVQMLAELVHWNWSRQGRHAEFGRISIRQLVDRAVLHDDTHLAQIRALKTAAAQDTSQPTTV